MHVLKELYQNTQGKIYCLVRGKDPKKKFTELFRFYFQGDPSFEVVQRRIVFLNGDITETKLGLNESDYERIAQNVSVVIHSASLVKHFGTYSEFDRINVQGTQKVIDFCLAYDKYFSYISTISISGNYMSNIVLDQIFTEKDLFIGQITKPMYIFGVNSKRNVW